MKFKKLGVLPQIREPESVKNSDLNQVLADTNVLILHAALDLVNLFREGSPSKRRRQWHPTQVLLPGKSHGQKSMVGYSPWGCEESDMTEAT